MSATAVGACSDPKVRGRTVATASACPVERGPGSTPRQCTRVQKMPIISSEPAAVLFSLCARAPHGRGWQSPPRATQPARTGAHTPCPCGRRHQAIMHILQPFCVPDSAPGTAAARAKVLKLHPCHHVWQACRLRAQPQPLIAEREAEHTVLRIKQACTLHVREAVLRAHCAPHGSLPAARPLPPS